jgi:hypothetical protein
VRNLYRFYRRDCVAGIVYRRYKEKKGWYSGNTKPFLNFVSFCRKIAFKQKITKEPKTVSQEFFTEGSEENED